MTATQAKYEGAFRVLVHHDHAFGWEQVPDGYQPAPGDVLATSISGQVGQRTVIDAPWSVVGFHPASIQQIHDDRHAARESIEEHIATCTDPECAENPLTPAHLALPYRSDLVIVLRHIEDAVLPQLTDTVTGFQCDEHPEIAAFLNMAFGLEFDVTLVPSVEECIYGDRAQIEAIEESLS